MDRVFSFLLWPKREARGPWKQGRKKRGSITCLTDRAYEANKMFIIWLCWLFRFWKGGSRVRGPYGYLRTWNWPITAREISQPYNKIQYNTLQYNTIHFRCSPRGFSPTCYIKCMVQWLWVKARPLSAVHNDLILRHKIAPSVNTYTCVHMHMYVQV